ncbi:MAG: 3-dehydroquinate synthase [Glaciecola sp.]|jgi:3-dehydroquinate synthase
MATLTVELGARSYPIHIVPNGLSDASHFSQIKSERIVIVTNTTVAPVYLDTLKQTLARACTGSTSDIILPDGEQYKDLAHFEKIQSALLSVHASRDTTLIALGGGVIGDITGFAAACFQRGIDFMQVPTTLLAQVDSSVGGKTAVNHPLGKNMIGAFYQPQAVIIDTQTLRTLPPREFAAGMAEVIKYGIIYDADLFDWLEQHSADIRTLEPTALSHIIERCCAIKAEIVAQDEREKGLRALLNLGHTFGHAIEAEMGYGNWLHGEAVAAGTIIASHVAQQKGWLNETDVSRIRALHAAFDLPVKGPDSMTVDTYMQHMAHDKKVLAGAIRFIIPQGIGHAVVTADVTTAEIQQAIEA